MLLDAFNQDLSQAYKVLSSFYLYGITGDILDELSEEFELSPDMDPPEDIEEDFFNLISSPAAVLPPYESLYASDIAEHGSIKGTIPEDVSRFYADAGLDLAPEMTTIAPDHLGLEMLFVSYLIENNRIDVLRRFFSLHIISWVPHYCDLLKEEAQTAFMKEIAGITKELVLTDFEDLSHG